MSVSLYEDVWVVVEQLVGPHAPRPLPLESGFSPDRSYKILGLHCPSETAEAYFILCNDRNEMWFISNRHFRIADGNRYSKALYSSNGHAKDAITLL